MPTPPRFDRRSLEKRGDQTGQDGNLQRAQTEQKGEGENKTTKNKNNKKTKRKKTCSKTNKTKAAGRGGQ